MRVIIVVSLFLLLCWRVKGCTTDVDCNLNGECTNGACVCDYSWSGTNCTTINFNPAPAIGAYGYSPNITAWGGLPILIGNTYHLYVTEIINHCGLCTWGSNSRVIHATSHDLLGPYTFLNDSLPIWAHNPHIVVDNSTGTPTYLLFHIGDADGGNPKVCNGTDDIPLFNKDINSNKNIKAPVESGILHVATDPNGPWTPQTPPGLGLCNNPAPYVFPNGTIFLVCSQGAPNIFTAPNWKGPWTGTQLNYMGNPGEGIWEDPFIWRDKRGVFKMLAHVYPRQGTSPHFYDRVSGYAYSHDGFNWVRQPWQPYTNVVKHVNGTVGYTTRERPKIFFDPSDRTTPLALFNGVAEGTNCYDCKQTCGVDWTFNLAVGIAP